MNFEKMRNDFEVFYDISGRIDTQTAPDLEDEIDATLLESENEFEGKIDLVLNFKEVEYISSAGLRAILHTKKQIDKMPKESTFKIININSEVMEIFEMTGFNEFLTLEKSE